MIDRLVAPEAGRGIGGNPIGAFSNVSNGPKRDSATCASAFWRVRVPAVGPGQQVVAAGLVRPIFPGAPRLARIGAVAPVEGRNLTLCQVHDLTAQLTGPHQRSHVSQ